jgi:hypothetical protein
MENIFLIGVVISVIYVVINLLELKYFNNTNETNASTKPIKQIIKEGLIVYLSVISGFYILQQFTPEVKKIISNEAPPLVFIDNPPF